MAVLDVRKKIYLKLEKELLELQSEHRWKACKEVYDRMVEEFPEIHTERMQEFTDKLYDGINKSDT